MRILLEMKTFNEIDDGTFQPQPIVALYRSESPIAQVIIHLYVSAARRGVEIVL